MNINTRSIVLMDVIIQKTIIKIADADLLTKINIVMAEPVVCVLPARQVQQDQQVQWVRGDKMD
jgi:hypothetical protein